MANTIKVNDKQNVFDKHIKTIQRWRNAVEIVIPLENSATNMKHVIS